MSYTILCYQCSKLIETTNIDPCGESYICKQCHDDWLYANINPQQYKYMIQFKQFYNDTESEVVYGEGSLYDMMLDINCTCMGESFMSTITDATFCIPLNPKITMEEFKALMEDYLVVDKWEIKKIKEPKEMVLLKRVFKHIADSYFNDHKLSPWYLQKVSFDRGLGEDIGNFINGRDHKYFKIMKNKHDR